MDKDVLQFMGIFAVLVVILSLVELQPTGYAVNEGQYQGHIAGIGTSVIEFKQPSILSQIQGNTCFRHKKTGNYYRLKFSAYSKTSSGDTLQFTQEFPQSPNWLGGKGSGCHPFTLESPSAFAPLDKIVFEGVNVKGRPSFSADATITLKSENAPVATPPPQITPSPEPVVQTPPPQITPATPTPDTNTAQIQQQAAQVQVEQAQQQVVPIPQQVPAQQPLPLPEIIDAAVEVESEKVLYLANEFKHVNLNSVPEKAPFFIMFTIKNKGDQEIQPLYTIQMGQDKIEKVVTSLLGKDGRFKVEQPYSGLSAGSYPLTIKATAGSKTDSNPNNNEWQGTLTILPNKPTEQTPYSQPTPVTPPPAVTPPVPVTTPTSSNLNVDLSQFKLTQKYVEINVNDVKAGDPPLVVEFFIRNLGTTAIQPEYEITIDNNPPVRKKVNLELSANGAQLFKESLIAPIHTTLTPGKHTIEFKIVGTDIVKKTEITVVQQVMQPKTLKIGCSVMSDEGNQCFMNGREVEGICKRGLSDTGKNLLPTVKCIALTGNLNGCEYWGSPCSTGGENGICAYVNPSAKDVRLRCVLKTCTDPAMIPIEDQQTKIMSCVKKDTLDYSSVLKCSDSDGGANRALRGKVTYQYFGVWNKVQTSALGDTCYLRLANGDYKTLGFGGCKHAKNCFVKEFSCEQDKNIINARKSPVKEEFIQCVTCDKGACK